MELLKLYESILKCGSLSVDDNGFVSVNLLNSNSPCTIGGKRLVLPTQAHLSNPNPSEKIIFHPLSENILRGESEIITKMRQVFNIKLNYTFGAVAQALLSIISSVAEHHKLTPDQSEIFSIIKEADETSVVNFSKVLMSVNADTSDKLFINIYLKRGGIVKDKKYSRVGVVTFPFYESLLSDTDTLNGVKVRAKDKELFIKLYQYILPNVEIPESYNIGSNSDIAPFLDALMKTVMNSASKINDVVELYKNLIDSPEDLVYDSDWVETFENLSVMVPQIRQIPAQLGNEGNTKVVTTPTQFSPPSEPLRTIPAAPVTAAPTAYPHIGYTPPAPLSTPTGIVKTDRGIDFNSILRTNPALANPNGFNTGIPTMQQMAPVDNRPIWDRAPQFPQNQFAPQQQFQPNPYQNPYAPQPQQNMFQQPQRQLQPWESYPSSPTGVV